MRTRSLLVVSLWLLGLGLGWSKGASRAYGGTDEIAGQRAAGLSFSTLPTALPIPLIGGFAGACQDHLIIFGGRFASSGSFNETIFIRDLESKNNQARGWQTLAGSRARALGCSAVANGSLYCLGGIGAEGPSRSVTRVSLVNGLARMESLSDLPFPLVAAGATAMDNSLFVFGGARAPAGAELSGELLRLDLNSQSSGWTRLATLPADPRFMSAVCAQGGQINVFGGYRKNGTSGNFVVCSDAWAYRPAPIDGTNVTGWVRLSDIPFSLAGAAAWPTGQSNIFLCGGANTGASFGQLTAGIPPQANRRLLAYNTVVDSYADDGEWTRPLFGATPVAWDSRSVLVGGRGIDGSVSNLIEMKIQSQVRRLSYLDYGVILAYFGLFTAIGAFFARKQTSSDNFALGGRSVKWWLAGISLYATGTSAISYMAIPAQTYATNIIWWVAPVPLAALALIPQAYLVIPLIRRLNVTSTYEYLERRFNPALRLLASGQCIVFQVAGRMTVIMLLPALAISAVTGVSLLAAVLIMGAITTLYTAIGGIDAVIWTDAIQTILTLGGPLLALLIIFTSFDGHPMEVFSIAAKYSKFKMFLFDWNFTLPVFWIAVIATIFSMVGFAGDQTQVQRILATPNVRQARRATFTCFAIVIFGGTMFYFLGVAAFSYFHAHPNDLDPKMANDQVVPLFIVQKMPIGIAGLIIASIFGASMSALSGTINSVATLITEDFYRRIHPTATDRQRLRLMKLTSCTVGILATLIACYMARSNFRSVFETWSKMIALLGGGFVGVFTLGIFTVRANSAGAIIGAIFSVLFTLIIKGFTPLHWTLYAPAAIGSCVIVGYFASFLFPTPSRNLQGLTVYTARPAHAVVDGEALLPISA